MGTEELSTHAPIPPLPGRAFHLQVQPATRLTWVGAGWAALCGVVAAGSFNFGVDTAMPMLMALVLADAVLGGVWRALIGLRNPSPDGPATANPDAGDPPDAGSPQDVVPQAEPAVEEPGFEPVPTSFWASVIAGFDRPAFGRLSDVLRRSWRLAGSTWRRVAVTHRHRVVELLALSTLALLMSLVLGPGVAVLVVSGLGFPLLAWFALGGYPLGDAWTRAAVEMGLGWAIGLAVFAPLPAGGLDGLAGLALSTALWAGQHAPALGVGLLFAVAYYGHLSLDRPRRGLWRGALLLLPQVAVAALLVAWHRPILAGAAALLVLAQTLFQPYLGGRHMRWYLRTTQWALMGVMLIAALGLAGHGA